MESSNHDFSNLNLKRPKCEMNWERISWLVFAILLIALLVTIGSIYLIRKQERENLQNTSFNQTYLM